MKKVFINYSWDHDAASAQAIYDSLSATQQFDVWKDKEKLVGGMEWRRTLRDTIREADYFICILSEKSINARRGVRFAEIRVALDVLQEFAPGEVYLIPTRADNCTPKFSELKDLNYVDLFPELSAGISKLLVALGYTTATPPTLSMPAPAKPIARNSVASSERLMSEQIRPKPGSAKLPTNPVALKPMHKYSVGLVNIDMGDTTISSIAEQLNKAQDFFLFTSPKMPDISNCTQKFGRINNFAVFKVPKSYIGKHPQLAADLIACFTQLPLAFDEGDHFAYNYFAGPSDQDERFMFVSADRLEAYSQQAGCTYNEGLVSTLVSQLASYFTGMGYHEDTRGCVMDFCENRDDIVESLKTRNFCKSCFAKLKDEELKAALRKLLTLKL